MIFVLSFEDKNIREDYERYFLPTIQINHCNVMSDLKKYYKLIAIDLSKQQKLDADPKAIQQINFTGNLERNGDTQIFFIIEEVKKTTLYFSKGTIKVL